MQAILGRSYPGLFPFGSAPALARLLGRVEEDAAFLAELRRRCQARRGVVSPEREKAALRAILQDLARRIRAGGGR
jgi:hypothetical protein